MENGPGVSLFQSTEVLKLNTSANREEEEEALEDAKRHNEELKNLLTNAFDDLSDDDDDGHSTLNSSRTDISCNGEGRIFGDIDVKNFSDEIMYRERKALQPLNKDNRSSNILLNGPNHREINKENLQSPTLKHGQYDEQKEPVFKHLIYENVNPQEAYRQAESNSLDQLQILYEVRLREVKRLTEQVEKEQKESAEYKDQMFRKLALCEAEKERAILSRTQANELLVQSKSEISELQKNVASLSQNVSGLEKIKSELTKELNLARTMINELQEKLMMLERCDVKKNVEKEMDNVIKELKNKHQQEISNIQRKIDFITTKCNQKENDCSILEQRISDMQRAQESLLIEKSDTINQLARSLEESQAQCRQLMASNTSCENIRLQTLLEEANSEKRELQKALKTIQTECDMLRSDVAQYESFTKLNLPSDNSSDETDSIVHLGISHKTSSRRISNMNITDIGSKLKEELHRAVLNQKAKRMEICRLQETLNAKEKQIEEMSKKERMYLIQTESLKEEIAKVMDQFKTQRESDNTKEKVADVISKEEIDRLNERIEKLLKEKFDLEVVKQELEEKCNSLQREIIQKLEGFEEKKQKLLEVYKREYLQFHDETVSRLRNEMEKANELKVNETRLQLEETLKELEEVKGLYIEVSKAKEKLIQELKYEKDLREKLENEMLELTAVQDKLNKKLTNSKQVNDELNSKLKNLEEELSKKDTSNTIKKLTNECDHLRFEITEMSNVHAEELDNVRKELQGSRERLINLEKNLCSKLESEVVKVGLEKEELRRNYEEKETNLKRIIEAQKRRPILRDISTNTTSITDDSKKNLCNCEIKFNDLSAQHEQEIKFYKAQINNMIKHHQEETNNLNLKAEEEMEKLRENFNQLLEAIQSRIVKEEEEQKIKHCNELLLVEEKTKELAEKFFSEKFHQMEVQFNKQLQAANQTDCGVVERLKEELADKGKEIFILKEAFSNCYKEYEKKIATLNKGIEEDREKMSEVINHWAQEVKSMKSQINEKDNTITSLRTKLKDVKAKAKAYRNQLTGSRKNLITAQAKMEAILTEKEKEVDIKIEEIERQYEIKEKELRNKLNPRACS